MSLSLLTDTGSYFETKGLLSDSVDPSVDNLLWQRRVVEVIEEASDEDAVVRALAAIAAEGVLDGEEERWLIWPHNRTADADFDELHGSVADWVLDDRNPETLVGALGAQDLTPDERSGVAAQVYSDLVPRLGLDGSEVL